MGARALEETLARSGGERGEDGVLRNGCGSSSDHARNKREVDQGGVVGRCESGARSGVELISSRLIFTIGEGRQRFGIQQFDSIIATGDPACRFE